MSPAGRMGKQDPYPMWAPNKPLFRVQALGGVCGVGGDSSSAPITTMATLSLEAVMF